MKKVTVVGAGRIGSKIAYEIARRGDAKEVALVDVFQDAAISNALDIDQAVAFMNDTDVISGDFSVMAGSSVVVVTAGKGRTPDMKDRMELIDVNKGIISSVCAEIKKYAPKAIVIVCTNPMDVMNYVAYRELGFDSSKVIGFGGRLDSLRFSRAIYQDHKKKVSCMVIGEHGESMVPLFSSVRVGGRKVEIDDDYKSKVIAKVRGVSKEIIAKKGATEFAPASACADMVSAILGDTSEVMPCSVFDESRGVSIGVPCKLTSKGAEPVKFKMDASEEKAFLASVKRLKDVVDKIDN